MSRHGCGELLTVDFTHLAVNDAVALVHVHILHAIVFPFTEELVDLLPAFDLGRVQGNNPGSWLDLKNTGKPILVRK